MKHQVVVTKTTRPSKLLGAVAFLSLLMAAPAQVMPLPSGGVAQVTLVKGGIEYHDPVTLATVVTVTTTGAGSFVIPATVTSIFVEGWSAGGGSGNLSTSNEPGGGGGAYVSVTFVSTPGDSIFWVVGAGSVGADGGGTWFDYNVNSIANAWNIGGGRAPTGTTGGFAGSVTSGSQGTISVSGAGGIGAAQQAGGGSRGGGGGGGCGGPNGNGSAGTAGSGSAGGAGGTGNAGSTASNTANVDGAGGGNGGASAATGSTGPDPGGGGGGAGNSSTGTTAGGRGQLRYTYTANSPSFIFDPFSKMRPFLAR